MKKSLKFYVFLLERKIKKFLIILFSLLVFLSCAAPFGVYHRVKKNETLYSIAKLYGTTVDKLEKNNNIADAKKIMPGDYIFVPDVAAPKESVGEAKSAHSNVKEKESQNSVKQQTAPKNQVKADPTVKSRGKTAYIWPVKGVVTSNFGTRWGRHHSGIDIGCPEGTPIYAAAAGKVVFVGEKGGYGLLIVISHSDGSFTIYAHNSKNIAKENSNVKQGEKIAEVGSTGNSTGPHLHFEIRLQSKPVDPLLYLPKTVP